MIGLRKILILCVFVQILGSSCNTNLQSEKSNEEINALPADLKLINTYIQENPNHAEGYYKRAQYFLNQKEWERCDNDLIKVFSIDSTKSKYFQLKADLYFILNKTSITKTCLEKAISLDSTNSEALLKLAELYLYVKMYQPSIDNVNKALRINKNLAKAYFIKGINYLQIGDTLKAVSNFKTTIEQDQEYYASYIQLGLLYSQRKDGVAIDYFNSALNLNPKSEEAHYGLGMFYMDKGELNKSLAQFSNAIQINPRNADAYYAMGFIHFDKLKATSEARKYFNNAVAADPKMAKAWFMLGLTTETLGDIAAAKTSYKNALLINPLYEKAKLGFERVSK